MAEGDGRLKELSERLGSTMNRIDEIQRKPSWGARLRHHFRAQSGSIFNVLLAGCAFSIAMGRLAQKHEHEEERQRWQEQLDNVTAQNASLQQRAEQADQQRQELRELVARELAAGGWRLSPVAARIREVLEPAASSVPESAGEGSRQPPRPGAALPAPVQPAPPHGKIMV